MKLFILFAMFVLSSAIVNASAEITVNPSLVDFGTVSLDAATTKTIEIKNTGTTPLTNISFSSNIETKYRFNATITGSNIPAGDSRTANLQIFFPYDETEEAGNITLGNLTITSSEDSITIPVYANLQWLSIYDITVTIDSESEGDLVDGEVISDSAKPMDKVEFDIELKNLFDSDDEDYTIEDVQVSATLEDIDDGSDIKDESETVSINPEDRKTVKISFTIPEIVIADTYAIQFEIDGKNTETKERYKIVSYLKLNVEKKKNDIQIRAYEFTPSELQCSLHTNLEIRLLNLGEQSEDAVAIEVKNADLNVAERFEDIKLGKDYDRDAWYTKIISIDLDPQLALPGTYPLIINAYFDDNKLDDQKTADLVINNCSQTQVPEQQIEQTIPQPESISNGSEIVPASIPPTLITADESTASSANFIPFIPVIKIGNSRTLESYYPQLLGLLVVVGVIILISLLISYSKRD